MAKCNQLISLPFKGLIKIFSGSGNFLLGEDLLCSTIQYNTISDLYYKLSSSANNNYENDSVNKNAFRCRLKTLVSVIVR